MTDGEGSGRLAGMLRTHTLLLLGLLAAGTRVCTGQWRRGGAVDPAPGPELRGMERRLGEIAREMERLPVVRERPWGLRYGYRSADLPDETTVDWLQLDLGGQRRVALMPVNLSYLGEEGAGDGFPKRFRVEISDHPDMRDAVVVVVSQGRVNNRKFVQTLKR